MEKRSDDSALFDDSHDSRMSRNRIIPPRGPKSYRIEKAPGGIRVTVFEWPSDSIEVTGSSASEFVVEWAEDVDTTTNAGVIAGEARATLLSPTIASMGEEARPDRPISAFYPDPKYAAGFFFVRGKNASGQLSPVTPPQRILGSSAANSALPSDVEHFQASESGEQHGQTVLSVIDYAFRIPFTGGPIDRVQFMYFNYPNLNEFSEGESVRVTASRGGTQTGKLRLPIGRRIGDGTITIAGANVTGVGTTFLSVAASAGGDQLEAFGYRARIASVTSNTAMTLTGAWGGPDVSAVADWQTIASVTIFAVSEGFNGARRDDPENSPPVTLDLDGELSAPIAPTLDATTIGNAIRLVITPSAGTELARALLYKHIGSGLAFDRSTWQMIHAFAIDAQNPSPFFQWDDTDFLLFDRENGQVFSYAASVVNVRDEESPVSTIAEAACKLDAPGDNAPTNPAREIALNQLWNGHINGTALGAVNAGDVVQDVNMGGAPPAGRSRWYGAVAGVGSAPGHVSTNEVVLAMTGAGAGTSALHQDIGAVDNAVAANRRIPTWKAHHLQFKARTSGGQPNGILYADILQFSGAVQTAAAGCVRRLSDDSIDISQAFLAIDGSDVLTDHQVYHAAFILDDTVVTTKIIARIYYSVTNWNGVNIFVTEAMLSIGEALPQYTPQMADPSITFSRTTGGAPSPPPIFDPDEGTGKPWAEPIQP